jgi:hypothetical protein
MLRSARAFNSTVLAQSWAAASGAADTNENALATITVPPGAMGLNGVLRISTLWTTTNNANAKTLRIRFSGAAGTQYFSQNVASSLATGTIHLIANRGVANSQVGYPAGSAATVYGPSGNGVVTSAVDTAAATTIVISCQKATAGDTITLEGYTVELIKP